jgi:hypothetical protein
LFKETLFLHTGKKAQNDLFPNETKAEPDVPLDTHARMKGCRGGRNDIILYE